MNCKWLEKDGQCLLFLEPCRGSDCQNKEDKDVSKNSVSAVDRMCGRNHSNDFRHRKENQRE